MTWRRADRSGHWVVSHFRSLTLTWDIDPKTAVGFPLETILFAWLALAAQASSRSPVLLGCGFGWVLGAGDWDLRLLGVIFSGTSCWWGRGVLIGRLEPLHPHHVAPQPLQAQGQPEPGLLKPQLGCGEDSAAASRGEGGGAGQQRRCVEAPAERGPADGGRAPLPGRPPAGWASLSLARVLSQPSGFLLPDCLSPFSTSKCFSYH